ncbi:hypothetical protein BO86DRAFT_424640 [Aspergillus japonicus CBS 114.51]|uniref:Uncharacterized protein n=1 Tax=Aspergillus japonicus CBS 114.51 TaxID=1448312 RepID=A0A8T8X999_ASPJA|nr:hypothetical protein BO86DRAFT_424640 [Aspergillus japonicus CBS 114.51]RAH84132.1 hypothetical protein BO86DRAFT_424640 [Aspergillus japonicus CBS 114.51]
MYSPAGQHWIVDSRGRAHPTGSLADPSDRDVTGGLSGVASGLNRPPLFVYTLALNPQQQPEPEPQQSRASKSNVHDSAVKREQYSTFHVGGKMGPQTRLLMVIHGRSMAECVRVHITGCLSPPTWSFPFPSRHTPSVRPPRGPGSEEQPLCQNRRSSLRPSLELCFALLPHGAERYPKILSLGSADKELPARLLDTRRRLPPFESSKSKYQLSSLKYINLPPLPEEPD